MLEMTELEERLAQPEGGKLRDQIVNELAQMELRLRRSRMLPRQEYRQVSALADAAQAAQETLGSWPVATAKRPQVAGPAQQAQRF